MATTGRSRHEPSASIIIPVRNGAEFVRRAVLRAAAAAPDDAEIIVVDDGSDDETGARARQCAAEAPTLRVLRCDDGAGVSGARRFGATHARGRFLWFVDVDDDWPADALTTMLSAAERHDADLVLAQGVYVTPSGRIKPVEHNPRVEVLQPGEAFRRFLCDEVTGHLWNKLASRALVASIEFVPTVVHSDQSIVAQLTGNARRAVVIPDVVYRYLQRPGSLVRAGRPKYASLARVRDVTHAVARDLGARQDAAAADAEALETALAFYDLRSIALTSAEDVLDTSLPRSDRRAIRRRTRDLVSGRGIQAARARGDRRTWALGLAARHAPRLFELYLEVRRRRGRIARR